MEEVIEEFSFGELRLMINMSLIKNEELLTLSTLAERIHTQSSAPGFVKVMNYLKKNQILKVKPYLGNTKIVTIDNRKLTDIIDEHFITNLFYAYFKEYHIVSW